MIYDTDADVAELDAPGKYSFGGGLYLQVQSPTSKSWLYRYMLRGKQRWMGLGSVSEISVKRARIKRDGAHSKVVDEKVDPVEQRKRPPGKTYRRTGTVTFREAAQQCIEDKRPSWRNSKHAAQWESSLKNYAYPIIGDMPVGDIEREHVVEVLKQPDANGKPIWISKRETANRLRGRIEDVLVTAMANRWRPEQDITPATLTKLLKKQLGARPTRKIKHHAALPHKQVAAFVADLAKCNGVAPRALAFMILTCTRTGDVIGARWNEFDLDARVWSIPAERMKAERPHNVALSGAAVAILEEMQKRRDGDFVFTGPRLGRPLSTAAMAKVAKGLAAKHGHITPHGFRSTFKDWAREEHREWQDWLSEAILAHESGDQVLRAYARTEAMKMRREVMETWAAYCTAAPDGDGATGENVVKIRNRKRAAG